MRNQKGMGERKGYTQRERTEYNCLPRRRRRMLDEEKRTGGKSSQEESETGRRNTKRRRTNQETRGWVIKGQRRTRACQDRKAQTGRKGGGDERR